jgi:NAD(P)-dependent dehydrogenase (short-subunit alcohol dehydrogenase family)
MNTGVLITGANIGLGKETARQIAQSGETKKIILACRNPEKAAAAKKDLETSTGRTIFEIAIMDITDPTSVKKAITELSSPVDALVLNAGGLGGKNPGAIPDSGMNFISATNILDHVVLVEELIKAEKLNKRVVYVSSEAARGIPKMGMERPDLKTSSIDEFATVLDGSFFGEKIDSSAAYGYVKYIGTLWMSSLAHKHKSIEFVSVSPGATKGTAVADNIPGMLKFMFKYVMFPIVLPLRGVVHSVDKGAARYVEALNNSTFQSGEFYASNEQGVTGPLEEQGPIFTDLKNKEYQDNANEEIHRFIK